MTEFVDGIRTYVLDQWVVERQYIDGTWHEARAHDTRQWAEHDMAEYAECEIVTRLVHRVSVVAEELLP